MNNGDLWAENQVLRQKLLEEREKRLAVEAEVLWMRRGLRQEILRTQSVQRQNTEYAIAELKKAVR